MAKPTAAQIHSDEQLLFFPTIGRFEADAGSWYLPIHGWIFKPEFDSLRRAAAVSLLRRWVGLEASGLESELFEARLRSFLVNNRPRKVVAVSLDEQHYSLIRSAANGHIVDALRLSPTAIDVVLAKQTSNVPPAANDGRVLQFDAILPAGDARAVSGAIHLLNEQGLSVISDIDDTIKITHVHDRVALLRQTFLREFEPVPGMAELYRRWRAAGATFHYASRSPWQLFTPIGDFLAAHGFPAGTFHMRHFRWRNAGTLKRDRTGSKKLAVIDEILAALPHRRFVFVGDSGEHDPEIYGALARRYSEQVRAIFIRNVTGEDATSDRLQRAFADLPIERWQLFDDAQELPLDLS
ncbi:MAG TPA: App1 family protein [Pirellulales bacterium]|jgi:hypothetical protein